MLLLKCDRVTHPHGRGHGHRINHNAELVALDPRDFSGLLIGGQVFMNDANATLLCHGNR